MKDLIVAAYWALVGALIVFVFSLIVPVLPTFYLTVYFAGSSGLPAFVLAIPFVIGLAGALAMGLIGLSFTRRENVWAALLGFGGFPAGWLTFTLVREASRLTWSCPWISFEPSGEVYGYGGSGIEDVVCETIPGQLVVAAAIFWGITVLGLALWFATRHLGDAGRAV